MENHQLGHNYVQLAEKIEDIILHCSRAKAYKSLLQDFLSTISYII